MMQAKLWRVPLALAVALFTLTATACAGSGAGGGGGGDIVIGNVSAETGSQSSTLAGQLTGLQAWVSYTNAKGGIGGKQIKVVSQDSKSDPTGEAAAFQQIGSQDKPLAFVGVGVFNPLAAIPAIGKLGIPVIGGAVTDAAWQKSPLFYAQGMAGNVQPYTMGAAAKGAKVGVVYCSENAGCSQGADLLKTNAGLAGATFSFAQKLSMATPDFTSACLAARDSGTQYLSVLFNTPNYIRLAHDCARQGYHPKYLVSSVVGTDALAANPDFEGATVFSTNYPWWDTTGPGATFHQAMQQYEPNQPVDAAAMQGWAAGTLFGKAAQAALAKGALDQKSLIAALNATNGETLDGLSGPLRFTAQGNQPSQLCWFTGTAQGGMWVSAPGAAASCVPQDAAGKLAVSS